jgi:hypothetical protein
MNFVTFFQRTTSHLPHDYQRRLACGERQPQESVEAWLAHGTACHSKVINISTGLGKTAAVVLACLWNRLAARPNETKPLWPRRLVYCLPMNEKWESAGNPRPGAVYFVDVASGGYDDQRGWTGDPIDKPTQHPPNRGTLDTYSSNRLSFVSKWQTLADHTAEVVRAAEYLAVSLRVEERLRTVVRVAARWHDVGPHFEFQTMLRNGDDSRAAIHAHG